MGATPVLGYELPAGGGRLVVNREEARQVRAQFAFYVECGCIDEVLNTSQARGWMNKRWRKHVSAAELKTPFNKRSVRRLLRNPIYTGQMRHRDGTYAGEQDAIVDHAVW